MYQNTLYPTVEHAYQAAKVEDPEVKPIIQNCHTPAAAKDYLQTHSIKPSPEWTIEKKLAVMEELLRIKFGGKEPFVTRGLLATGDADLVEGNTWNDTFWGVCNGSGENHLGKILVKVRGELILQKQGILFQLGKAPGNEAVAAALAITPRKLYEKMVAFKIQNNRVRDFIKDFRKMTGLARSLQKYLAPSSGSCRLC